MNRCYIYGIINICIFKQQWCTLFCYIIVDILPFWHFILFIFKSHISRGSQLPLRMLLCMNAIIHLLGLRGERFVEVELWWMTQLQGLDWIESERNCYLKIEVYALQVFSISGDQISADVLIGVWLIILNVQSGLYCIFIVFLGF